MSDKRAPEQLGQMHRRRITLDDGRYLIFYTFGDEDKSSDTSEEKHQPQSESLTEEDKGV
ncbi:MAG: hypothetical protein DMF68_11535 [Acidobacteria bacterium]|nr:MAG: hypothetical protein DMF68_11535 [Acidobacteriota bacterium]